MKQHWKCPYCNRDTTITEQDYSESTHYVHEEGKDGVIALRTVVITCPNQECKDYAITATLHQVPHYHHSRQLGRILGQWSLKPQSSAVPFPDYIPGPIRADYEEACAIRTLSPKASATLSRRCLQGIIRDFWSVNKNRLIDEIDALRDKIDPLTWQAIDAVRQIGNIGAHMEKDINLVVEVDPDEAQLLIGLIETLIKDWYIARHERQKHLQGIVRMAEEKKGKKISSEGVAERSE